MVGKRAPGKFKIPSAGCLVLLVLAENWSRVWFSYPQPSPTTTTQAPFLLTPSRILTHCQWGGTGPPALHCQWTVPRRRLGRRAETGGLETARRGRASLLLSSPCIPSSFRSSPPAPLSVSGTGMSSALQCSHLLRSFRVLLFPPAGGHRGVPRSDLHNKAGKR